MEMTPRQRWLAILDRKTPDRIPTDFWSTGEVHRRLKTELGCADDEALWRALHIDRPRWTGPKQLVHHHPDDPQADIWGVRYTDIAYGTGSYAETAHRPLAEARTVAEVHAFKWPDPDWWDYSTVSSQLATDDGYRIVQGGVYEPFLLYANLRGLEQSFEDLVLEPQIADAVLGHIFDFHYEHNRRLWEAGRGKIDIMYLAEDLGSQHGPLMSLEMYRRFLLPGQKKMADLARSFGIHIIYHTDGAARIFLPDLVDEVGIEILNPIQWRCAGMEREGLVRDFGSKIAFHGSIDNQHTLPYGTVDEVRQEIRDSVRIYHGARWICAPCHNIQPVTPTQNIRTMYELVHELGQL